MSVCTPNARARLGIGYVPQGRLVFPQLTVRDNLLVGLTLVPIAVLANFLGIWMVRRVSTEMFFRIAYVLMFVIAVELVRSSIVELW